jgi:hypothetical protein
VSGSGDQIPVTPFNQTQYAYCQVFTPITQQGIGIVYHSGTANSPGNFPSHVGAEKGT